jgi:hypothetical protein
MAKGLGLLTVYVKHEVSCANCTKVVLGKENIPIETVLYFRRVQGSSCDKTSQPTTRERTVALNFSLKGKNKRMYFIDIT